MRRAIRALLRAPAFTAAAILSLALGIGVNTAVFGIADAILLRPLPVPRPDRLLSIYNHRVRGSALVSSNSFPDYEYLRDNARTLSGLFTYVKLPVTLRGADAALPLTAEMATPNYFDVLRLRPALGRAFAPGDENVVILSHRLWRTRFASRPETVGGAITLNRRPFTIVGVAPEDFRGIVLDWGKPTDLWCPLSQVGIVGEIPMAARDMHWLLVTGRLKDGVRLSDARAEMETLSAQLAQSYPKSNSDFRARVYPIQQARFWPGHRDSVLGYLELLAAIAGLVLLIACANVANLLLSRAARRRREVGIRIALGASRLRLARDLIAECVILAGAGALLGLLLSAWTATLLDRYQNPFGIPLNLSLGLNARVLAFAAALAVAVALAVALFPVRLASKVDISSLLKAGVETRRRFAVSDALVAAQFAICLVALAGAGLFLRTLDRARQSDPAFKAAPGLLATLEVGQKTALYSEALDRVSSLAGVVSAGYVWDVPMSGMRGATDVTVDGRRTNVNLNIVSEGWFATAGVPLLAGRDFRPSDGPSAPLAGIVNELMARALWPGEPAVGKRLRVRGGKADVEVVGIVRDGRMRSFREDPRACLYLPFRQDSRSALTLQIRTGPAPLSLLPAVRRELQSLDREMPVTIRTIQDHLDNALSRERMAATLLAILSAFATLLASVGLYGVMSTAVARRAREIGIRMALGAKASGVQVMVLKRSALLTALGLVAGLAASAGLAGVVRKLLFGVTPADPAVLLSAATLLAAVGLAAAWIPARRAATVDPIEVLRDN